jgi:hypothetical protein
MVEKPQDERLLEEDAPELQLQDDRIPYQTPKLIEVAPAPLAVEAALYP